MKKDIAMYQSVRKGNTQAQWNREYIDSLPTDFMIAAIGLALYFQSWWVFFITFSLLAALTAFKWSGLILVTVFSFPWALFFGGIAYWLFGLNAAMVIGLAVYIGCWGSRRSSLQYFRDLD